MTSLLAVVVSYHPSEILLENLRDLLEQVSHVVVVDNESSERSQKMLASMFRERVTVIANEKNHGVAQGFNQGVRWGLESHFSHFLLMDQDSRVTEGMVKELMKVLESSSIRNSLVMVGPHHEDFDRKLPESREVGVQKIPLLITSGSLIPRKVIEEIGLYDERLFIDHVDHDYCLRLQKRGGLCFQVNKATLLHRFGEARVQHIFGKSFFLQDYSPFRRYHMMRNRVVLYKRYGIFQGDWFWLDLKVALKDLVKLIFFEENKKAKLIAVFRGFLHGILWRDP